MFTSGIENVRDAFDSERNRHFPARAKRGYTTAIFASRTCIAEAGDAGSDGEEYFPVEIMNGFLQKYPEIDGIAVKIQDRSLVADWSLAVGEPSAADVSESD